MADEDTIKDVKKVHRERLSGRKAVKKKLKKEHGKEGAEKPKNTKAFTFNSAIRAERKFRRKQDLKTKKQHIPVVDRTPLEPPPIVVGVVGPPKVGKSTLIRCIIKSFTRQPLSTIKGPVTVVSGKKRRITFIECNNDINSMVDLAKVVDLVLLLIDASFGFEMEIFEFLNICQVHGMPKIMGVLTHLDMIKQTKKLQKTKKLLKRRFWTEVYAGAKLFYLSGLLHDAYLRNEIKNLARFISVMKFRPLVWQTTHSYVLADRIEDLTPPEQIRVNPKGDRTVCIYGYVRGIPLNENSFIHIPGCGDFVLHDICFLPDPCPLPQERKKRSLIEKERLIYAPFSGVGGIVYDKDAVYIEVKRGNTNVKQPHKEMIDSILEIKETMDDKLEKSTLRLFPDSAPITSSEFEQMQSQVKSVEETDGEGKPVNLDSNSGVKRKRFDFDSDSGDDDDELESDDDENKEMDNGDGEEEGEEENSLIKSALQREEEVRYRGVQTEKDKSIHDKITEALAVLDSKEKPCEEWSECSSSDDERDEGVGESEDEKLPWEKKDSDEASNDEESNEDSDEEPPDTDLNWKTNLAEKAAMAFLERQASDKSLWKLVYGESVSGEGDEEEEDDEKDEVGGLFKVVRQKQEDLARNKDKLNALDSSRFSGTQVRDWSLPQVENSIKDCFVTGKWKKEDDAGELLKLDDMEDSDDEMFGDFEDLETGEKFEAKKQDKNAENTEGGEPKEELTKEQLMEKKKKLKEKFDKEYDNKDDDETTYFDELKSEANKQAELNRSQFEGLDDSVRVKLEGFRAGMYVRMEINNVSPELIENFDPTYPLIVGGLQPGEQNVGFVKVRIKKHRWYHKILKTRDPLIISLGWRRFQTLTVYSKQEDDLRHRMLKYTPEHVNCMGHFWGPITRAGTGFLALQSVNINEMRPGFRIVATGTVVDTNQSTVVTKKLKLTGVPMKIYKKTAFIRGMFNSTLEVAKFEGAKIKTVSGIRGQIKRAVSKPEGAFRATFEDKILLSDIVFCRTWYKVDIPKFYAPVTTLLLPPDQKNSWTGMKTLGQIKRERGIQNEAQPDSMYTEIKRTTKAPLPLKVPRALEKELPYKYKLKGKALSEKEKIKNHTYKKVLHGPFMKKVGKIVIRDEYDSKVASMMDKLRMSFEAKQEKLKEETHQRIRQHQKQIRDEERKKFRRQRELKKDIFKALSKIEIQKQKKMGKSKRPRK